MAYTELHPIIAMNKTMYSEGMIVIKKFDQLWITLILFSFFVCLFVFANDLDIRLLSDYRKMKD